MENLKLCESDYRFMSVIWDNEPLPSGKLVELCNEKLGWKKSTTYTVLKRLCDKGIFQNIKGTVTSLISRQEFYSVQSEKFVEETFNGSLPAFLAAFTSRKKLTAEEISRLRRMVEEFEEG